MNWPQETFESEMILAAALVTNGITAKSLIPNNPNAQTLKKSIENKIQIIDAIEIEKFSPIYDEIKGEASSNTLEEALCLLKGNFEKLLKPLPDESPSQQVDA